MTVVASALTKGDGVVLVADSQISTDYSKANEGFCKLWVNETQGYVFGGAGSVRTLQVLKHWTSWPYFGPQFHDVEEFVVKEVVPQMRMALLEHGALTVNKKTETFDGSLIMAWNETLVVIEEDFGVFLPSSNRAAIGSGMSEALGSLGNRGIWIKSEVIEAARRSTITAVGVGEPLWVVSTRSLKVELI
jgi:hypothetical protein